MRQSHGPLGAALLCFAVLFGGCHASEPPPAPLPPAVTVARPVEREVIEWDEYTGHLDPVEFVQVRARVSGMVVSAAFHEGATVQQGELLVEIDVRPFQAELESRLADQARAAAQVDLAQVEFNRIDAIPATDRSATERDTATANLKQAQAVLAAAKAAAEVARLNVEWCRVTAPIAGRISRKNVTAGNLISGGGEQATLLTTITSIDPIYCYVDTDERSVLKYAKLAREGKRTSARQAQIPCIMQLADETGFPHEGVIDFVDNRVNPETGTIRARGVFPNADGWILPGFFGRVRIPGSGPYVARLVPDSAVMTDQNQKILIIVGPDNIVQPRAVKLGALFFGEFRAIESGIGPDERVVINGLMHARPGAKVTPQETTLSMESFRLTAPGSPATQALPRRQQSSATTPATDEPAEAGTLTTQRSAP